MEHLLQVLTDVGLAVPLVDSHWSREVFLSKGCIVCREINGVGGGIGPTLNADEMPEHINMFVRANVARCQRNDLGSAGPLVRSNRTQWQDLADLVDFAHDADEQSKLTADDIPEKFRPFSNDRTESTAAGSSEYSSVAAMVFASAALTQNAGLSPLDDPEHGRTIAQTWCAACLLVAADEDRTVLAGVPPSTAIAKRLPGDANVLAARSLTSSAYA